MVRIYWVTVNSHAEPLSLAFIHFYYWSTWLTWSLAIIGPLIPALIIDMNSWITIALHTIVCVCAYACVCYRTVMKRLQMLVVLKEAY